MVELEQLVPNCWPGPYSCPPMKGLSLCTVYFVWWVNTRLLLNRRGAADQLILDPGREKRKGFGLIGEMGKRGRQQRALYCLSTMTVDRCMEVASNREL